MFDVSTSLWTEPEREFTPYASTISALWPTLRHGQYHWKLVSSSSIAQWAYYRGNNMLEFGDYHCTSEEVLSCGETQVIEIQYNMPNHTLSTGNPSNETSCAFEGNTNQL